MNINAIKLYNIYFTTDVKAKKHAFSMFFAKEKYIYFE